MSLSYSNTPVYIGVPNTSGLNTGFTGSIDYVPALRSDISLSTSINPKRKLGVSIDSDDQFTFNGALSATIGIESVLQEGISEGFRFLSGATQEDYVPIEIGDNIYQKCYPTDISINIQPYLPATITANFVSLEPPTGMKISGDARNFKRLTQSNEAPITGDLFVYGHTCNVSQSMNAEAGDVKSQITFTRTYLRSPVYNLGSVGVSSMLLDGIEEELSISSTGLGKLINLSGNMLGTAVSVSLQEQGGGFDNGALVEIITFPEGARVINQGYGIVQGETLQTSLTLKQIKL